MTARASKGSSPPPGDNTLAAIPGCGKKTVKLFKNKDINTADELLAWHQKVLSENKNVLKELEAIGVMNVTYQQQITEHLDKMAWERYRMNARMSHAPGTAWLQPKVTLSVEGNISAGKSTFLKLIQGSDSLQDKLQVVPEPVEMWQAVGASRVNLLMEFYKAPERFAYTFQNYVFLTRVVQERNSYTSPHLHRLLERSVFSDRMVFVRAVHASKHISDTELAIYDGWFDPVLATLPTLVPNGFLYLRASPETCHRRLKKRAREEETTVGVDYLTELHGRHEDWLYAGGSPLTVKQAGEMHIWAQPASQVHPGAALGGPHAGFFGSGPRPAVAYTLQTCPAPEEMVQTGQAASVPLPALPSALGGAVRFMDAGRGAHMHPLLHCVPSLVIDCESDVDVEADADYKKSIVQKVESYTDFVREVMLAKGQASLALEQAVSRASGGQAAGTPFNGYSVDVKGTTLYLDASAPLLAYATRGRGPEAAPPLPKPAAAPQQQPEESGSAPERSSPAPVAASEEVETQQGKKAAVGSGR